MLAQSIEDDVESGAGTVRGLGLLPVEVTFDAEKVTALSVQAWEGLEVAGYEIHHGRHRVSGEAEPFLDGCTVAASAGTMLHGCFENDAFRRAYLAQVAAMTGSPWRPAPDAVGYGEARERMIDTLADAVEAHLDLDAMLTLASSDRTRR